jgi:sugar lactone lactonase YvrE
VLPAGFSAEVYVTGEGFDQATARGALGIPSVSTLAFDDTGVLYLARTGRRYAGGEVEDLWPIYRVPAGGARITPASEARYLHGPPLPNPQVATVRGGREVFVTTFDRDRKIGVVYRVVDGRVVMFAGGTPDPGAQPVLRQPEGAAADSAGRLYVADRDRNVVVRLDAAGGVLDPRYVTVMRPRMLAVDDDQLWVTGDGNAEAPWQSGRGEIWKVGPDGTPRTILRGPIAAAISLGPGRNLFVADRQGARVFALNDSGTQAEFARFTGGDAPRALCFAPDTPETRRLGIAGNLFLVRISRSAWPVNEILRIAGPFEQFARERLGGGP